MPCVAEDPVAEACQLWHEDPEQNGLIGCRPYRPCVRIPKYPEGEFDISISTIFQCPPSLWTVHWMCWRFFHGLLAARVCLELSGQISVLGIAKKMDAGVSG